MIQSLMVKKSAKPKDGRKSRLPSHTPDDLKAIAEELRVCAASFDALARAMKDQKVSSIDVDGANMAARGLDHVRNFASHVLRAMLKDSSFALELIQKTS